MSTCVCCDVVDVKVKLLAVIKCLITTSRGERACYVPLYVLKPLNWQKVIRIYGSISYGANSLLIPSQAQNLDAKTSSSVSLENVAIR